MLKLKCKTNPFGKAENSTVPFEGKTLRECLSPHFEGNDFQYPTFVRVNGTPWLRAEWDEVVPDDSEIEIIAVVGAAVPVLLIVNLVVLVASLAFTAYGIYKAKKAMRALRAGSGQADANPFFTVDGQGNKANLNSPVEVAYGRNRMWPSYIGRPYRTYFDDRLNGFSETDYVKNTNFVQVFCLGQGSYDIHSVQVGDILLESYRGMRCEIIPPGGTSLTISRIMYIQPDFEEIELAVDKSTDTFEMSPSGLSSINFEIDIEFQMDGESKIHAYVSEIDMLTGKVLDSTPNIIELKRPFRVTYGGIERKADSNSPPHRHTFSFVGGTPGKRYCVKVYNPATGSQLLKVLELRSYMAPTIPIGYADKTLLIVNYFVTELADNLVKDKINVIATRKLTTINLRGTERTEIVQPTNSIPWAIYDVLTNSVYGGGLSEEFIDLENFAELHGELERLDIGFNYVFNQITTVSDAIKVIAAAGRCSLTYNGSRLVLVRDNGNGMPEAMFSSENIIPGSLSWATEMFDPTDPDAVEVSYVETDSGVENTTIFTPEGSVGNNVQKISIQGLGSKTQAWREGAHRMMKTLLVRDTFKFKTGMEGYIPTIGATALLSSELEGMGVSGYIENYASGWLYLSRAVTVATPGTLGIIVLRRDDGSVMGPYTVTATSTEGLTGQFKGLFIGEITFFMEFWRPDKEPVHFIFSPTAIGIPVTTKIQIEKAVPSDDGTVEITASNFDSKAYGYDIVAVPADEYTPVAPGDTVFAPSWIKIDQVATPITAQGSPYTRIKWGACYGAVYYKVFVGNTVVWTGTDTYVELPIENGDDIQVTLFAINSLGTEGPAVEAKVSVGVDFYLSNPVLHPHEITEEGIKIAWDDVLGNAGYEVRISGQTSTILPESPTYQVLSTEFTYTKVMFKRDFGEVTVPTSTYTILFDVRAINKLDIPSAMTSLRLYLPIASAPINVVIEQDAQIVQNCQFTRHRTIKWEDSVIPNLPGTTYRIYMEVYAIGESSTLLIKPWVKITTSNKFLFASDIPAPRVQCSNVIIQPYYNGLPSAEYTDPVYGQGCMAVIDGDFILDMGDKLDNSVYIYNPLYPNDGHFHPVTKYGTSQIDGIVWVAKATETYLTGKRASVVYPHKGLDSSLGIDYRIKGAIVADNGWFTPTPPNSTTMFDIDA